MGPPHRGYHCHPPRQLGRRSFSPSTGGEERGTSEEDNALLAESQPQRLDIFTSVHQGMQDFRYHNGGLLDRESARFVCTLLQSSKQGWGKIRPIRIRIRIREYSANSNFAHECKIRRIRSRILKLKFEFG
jgi:hypothetical protein